MVETETQKINAQEKKPLRLRGWLIAFFIPLVFSFTGGTALDYKDHQDESGKDVVAGNPRTDAEYFILSSQFGLMVGVAAGAIGLAGYGVYFVLRSALSRK